MDGWGEAKVQQAPDVPVTNTFPQVEVCSPGGCVAAGKLCNEQKAGSPPDQIPTQPHIYRAFQKCSAYQWVLLTCWSRQQECKLCLVRCAVNRLLRQEYIPTSHLFAILHFILQIDWITQCLNWKMFKTTYERLQVFCLHWSLSCWHMIFKRKEPSRKFHWSVFESLKIIWLRHKADV